MSNLGKEIQIRGCVFVFSVKLEKRSFHGTDLHRRGKKCTKMNKNKHVKCVQSKICGVVAPVALQILNSLLSTSTTGVSPLNKAEIVKLLATQKYTR